MQYNAYVIPYVKYGCNLLPGVQILRQAEFKFQQLLMKTYPIRYGIYDVKALFFVLVLD